MLYELRIYDAVAGRLPDISGRFANHTCALFRKHGVKYLGFWTDEIGRSNRLTYINVFDSMADRGEPVGQVRQRPGLAGSAQADRGQRPAG